MIFTQEAPLTRKWFSGRSCIRSNWNKLGVNFDEGGNRSARRKPSKLGWDRLKLNPHTTFVVRRGGRNNWCDMSTTPAWLHSFYARIASNYAWINEFLTLSRRRSKFNYESLPALEKALPTYLFSRRHISQRHNALLEFALAYHQAKRNPVFFAKLKLIQHLWVLLVKQFSLSGKRK